MPVFILLLPLRLYGMVVAKTKLNLCRKRHDLYLFLVTCMINLIQRSPDKLKHTTILMIGDSIWNKGFKELMRMEINFILLQKKEMHVYSFIDMDFKTSLINLNLSFKSNFYELLKIMHILP